MRKYKVMISRGFLYQTVGRLFKTKKEARDWVEKNYPGRYVKIVKVKKGDK